MPWRLKLVDYSFDCSINWKAWFIIQVNLYMFNAHTLCSNYLSDESCLFACLQFTKFDMRKKHTILLNSTASNSFTHNIVEFYYFKFLSLIWSVWASTSIFHVIVAMPLLLKKNICHWLSDMMLETFGCSCDNSFLSLS